jgi:hypothetical protein
MEKTKKWKNRVREKVHRKKKKNNKDQRGEEFERELEIQ